MKGADAARLIGLSAIWGASFLFMRIAVPSLGPVWLIAARLLFAALFLAIVARHLRVALDGRAHWRHYATLGLLNSALPFVLFAYAAQTASASLLSILNATAPLWAALIGALGTRRLPSSRALTGLALGIGGVLLLVGVESLHLPPGGGWAIAAGLCAAFCYGVVSHYAKRTQGPTPLANAHGSMWAAFILILPALLITTPPAQSPTAGTAAAVLALGVLCSGIAYLLYFRLIADLGPASALTVTFLIPVFGILWGALFLGEAIGWHTLGGTATVLIGTALVTGFSPAALLGRSQTAAR